MPISVTCECGARLEIDEKFLGKEIPCPDCNRPLPTAVPVKPPPLELPDNRRTSGLAVFSLAVGLVGLFTIIGSVAAIGTGLLAMRAIRRAKNLEGLSLARAGVAVGGAGIFLTLIFFISPFGLDGFYRELAFAFLGRINYNVGGLMENASQNYQIKKPSTGRWGVFTSAPSFNAQPQEATDDLIAVNLPTDAYMAWQHASADLNENEESIQSKIIERLRKSELVNLLGRLNGKLAPEPTNLAAKKVDNMREITLEMRLAGIERRFLVIYGVPRVGQHEVKFFVGCARASQFDRVQEQFREGFTSINGK